MDIDKQLNKSTINIDLVTISIGPIRAILKGKRKT